MNPPTAEPAWYRPYLDGVYSVGPGLHPFGKDLGNGSRDAEYFQRDADYDRYIENKRNVVINYPEQVTGRRDPSDNAISALRDLFGVEGALEDFAMTVQEDLVLVEVDSKIDNRITWLHVAAPNMWTPGEMVGKTYAEIHGVVPGMGPSLGAGGRILRRVSEGASYVRFVWGLVPDDRLTRLPGTYTVDAFGDSLDDVYVRIERQVLVGLVDVGALLFIIRTYVRPASDLPHEDRVAIAKAIRGMPQESREYKGIATSYERLASMLERS